MDSTCDPVDMLRYDQIIDDGTILMGNFAQQSEQTDVLLEVVHMMSEGYEYLAHLDLSSISHVNNNNNNNNYNVFTSEPNPQRGVGNNL